MDTQSPTNPTGWSEETSRLFLDYGRTFVPERDVQMQTIAALLSDLQAPGLILDLCCGEGLLAELLLERLPAVTVQALDGSPTMRQRAGERLARFGARAHCTAFDLASRAWRAPGVPVQAVVSSMAVHHLTGPQKQELFLDVYRMLAGDGALILADIVEPSGEAGRRLAADAWDEVVRRQSLALDGHTAAFDVFKSEGWNTFRYPDPDDIDQPSPLLDQLKWLEAAGFCEIGVHWLLAGHAVYSGRKPGARQAEPGAGPPDSAATSGPSTGP